MGVDINYLIFVAFVFLLVYIIIKIKPAGFRNQNMRILLGIGIIIITAPLWISGYIAASDFIKIYPAHAAVGVGIVSIIFFYIRYIMEQDNLVKTLLEEIILIDNDINSYSKIIGNKEFPLYKLNLINEIYLTKLASRYNWLSITELKRLLLRLNNKIKLINNYWEDIMNNHEISKAKKKFNKTLPDIVKLVNAIKKELKYCGYKVTNDADKP